MDFKYFLRFLHCLRRSFLAQRKKHERKPFYEWKEWSKLTFNLWIEVPDHSKCCSSVLAIQYNFVSGRFFCNYSLRFRNSKQLFSFYCFLFHMCALNEFYILNNCNNNNNDIAVRFRFFSKSVYSKQRAPRALSERWRKKALTKFMETNEILFTQYITIEQCRRRSVCIGPRIPERRE